MPLHQQLLVWILLLSPFVSVFAQQQQLLADLAQTMTGPTSALNGWDALIAYDWVALAQIMKSTAKLETRIPNFTTRFRDPFLSAGPTVSTTFSLSIKTPDILPIDDKGSINASFAISGTYVQFQGTKQAGKQQAFPKGIKLVVQTSLYGSTVGLQGQTSPQPRVMAAGQTVPLTTLPEGSSFAVCMQFQRQAVTVTGFPANSQKTAGVQAIVAQIKQHFQSAENKYCISELSATDQLLSSVGTSFTPTAVMLSTIAAADGTPGALLLWLLFSGTGQGNMNARPQLQLQDPSYNAVHPIPLGSTSAVWLAHDLVLNNYLIPSLSRRMTGVSVSPSAASSGFQLVATPIPVPASFGSYSDDTTNIDSFSWDGTTTATLTIRAGPLPQQSDVSDQDSATASVDIEADQLYEYWTNPKGLWDTHGGAKINFYSYGYGGWQIPDPTSVSLFIGLSGLMSGVFNWDAGLRERYVPAYFTNLHTPVTQSGPILTDPLNFSIASTLLSRKGEYRFVADGVHGIASPYDLVISGDIRPTKVSSATAASANDASWAYDSQLDMQASPIYQNTTATFKKCQDLCSSFFAVGCAAAVWQYSGPAATTCKLYADVSTPARVQAGVYTYVGYRSATVKTPEGLQWTRMAATDSPGNDLPPVMTKTWEACVGVCDSMTDPDFCQGVVWDAAGDGSGNHVCQLKSSFSPTADLASQTLWAAPRPVYTSASGASWPRTAGVLLSGSGIRTISHLTSFEACADQCDVVTGCAGFNWLFQIEPQDAPIVSKCFLLSSSTESSTVDNPGVTVFSGVRSTPPSSTGQQWIRSEQIDTNGGLVLDVSVTPSYEACLAKCEAWSGPQACAGFVWVYAGQSATNCWLKSTMIGPLPAADGLSLWSGVQQSGCSEDWCQPKQVICDNNSDSDFFGSQDYNCPDSTLTGLKTTGGFSDDFTNGKSPFRGGQIVGVI